MIFINVYSINRAEIGRHQKWCALTSEQLVLASACAMVFQCRDGNFRPHPAVWKPSIKGRFSYTGMSSTQASQKAARAMTTGNSEAPARIDMNMPMTSATPVAAKRFDLMR